MKIVAFCPIKLNSQRLPNKNFKLLGSKLLMNHSIITVLQSGLFDEVYVYCSDESIICELPKGVKFLKRNTSLDKDETRGREIYKSFAEKIKADYYFLFHVTSPYISIKSIESAIRSISNGYDSALSTMKIQTFAWYNNKGINFQTNNPIQTQLLEPIYLETSSFFLVNKSEFRKGIRYGKKPFFVQVDERESIDIDNIEDWEKAEKYY